MNKSVFVSIILPTFNRETLLVECIQSVLNQSYSDFELIISDDCSSDGTEIVVNELVDLDSRIKYFKNSVRLGLPGNRNSAISRSSGQCIFFIEDDMVLDSNCLRTLVDDYNFLISNGLSDESHFGAIAPALITESFHSKKTGIFNYLIRGSNKNLDKPCSISKFTGVHYYNFSPNFSNLQRVCDVHACSFYNASVIKMVGGYESSLYRGSFIYEETDLNERIKKSGGLFYFEPRAILYHKIKSFGGCRVKIFRYAYFFVLNHMIFLIRNQGLKTVYMAPFFLIHVAILAIGSMINVTRQFLMSD